MASSSKAIIKEAVSFRGENASERAACGEYDIECRSDCVGFCNCTDKSAFTLSFDAFIQHLNEGRIAFV